MYPWYPSLSTHLYLQETKLDLLTPDECSYFEKMLAPNRTNEICTGRKNSFPKHWKFKRLLSKTKKKYHFKLIGPSTNYLGFKKTKYNFYLGGTDSCQGKVLSLLEVYFDLISSPSPSIKIQIMGGKNTENLGLETPLLRNVKIFFSLFLFIFKFFTKICISLF